jgi:RecB family endonuclease NucS
MRIVIASCSAIYTGRGDTELAEAVRAIIFKDDGSISIHNDKSNKPLNYMGKDNVFTESIENGLLSWYFDTRKESLRIDMHQIISDTAYALELDGPGLVRDGTEDHLQAWLSDNTEVLGNGFTLVSREYQTGAGPVDLLVRDTEGNPVVVEVKRVAMLGSVDQALRYRNSLQEVEGFEKTRGIVAALDIRPNTFKLAEKRGIECIELPPTWKNSFK